MLDETVYYVRITWEGKAVLREKEAHYFVLEPAQENFAFSCAFVEEPLKEDVEVEMVLSAASDYWQQFWKNGGAVDFSGSTAAGAKELERRVVLSQYLMAILINGHNYQDARLRVYLPGNGGLLTAVAMMCAGWDGNELLTPGFPDDGSWKVVWEDLMVMP